MNIDFTFIKLNSYSACSFCLKNHQRVCDAKNNNITRRPGYVYR